MEEFSNITKILTEVEMGNMKNVARLGRLIKNNDPWMRTLVDIEAFKVALIFNRIIDSKVINLKFRLEFAIIICDSLNKFNVINPLIRLQTSLNTVGQFILELLLNCEDKVKYYNMFLNLLNSYKMCIIKKVVPYNSFTEQLLQRLMEVALANPVPTEFRTVCILILITVAKIPSQEKRIINIFLHIIQFNFESVKGCRISVENHNISIFSFFIMSLIQNLLVDSFSRAYSAYDNIFSSINNKCKDMKTFSNFSVLFDKIFGDILLMSNCLLWPVTGLIIPRLCKLFIENIETPGADYKFVIFSFNQYLKLALRVTNTYHQHEKIESKFRDLIPRNCWCGGLQEIILCIITNIRKNEATGDIVKAYKIFWKYKKFPSDGDSLINFPDKTENDALAAKYLLEFRNNTFYHSIENIVTICYHKSKMVRNAAVKGMCDLVTSFPIFLQYELVRNALLENYEIICATGREKFAQAMSIYIERFPTNLKINEILLIRLLNDPSLIVCRAALKGVSTLCTKFPVMSDSKLFLEVVLLFSSPEESIKKLVYLFFSSIWLNNRHLDTLIKICQTKHCLIISNLFEHAKSNDLVKTKEKLVVFTKNLVNVLNKIDTALRVATAKLILIITKIFPNSIVPHIPILSRLLFDTSINDYKFKHIICKTLTSLGSDVKEADLNIHEQTESALTELKSLPSYCYIEFIKLMLAVSENGHSFIKGIFNKSLKILQDVYNNKTNYSLVEINSSICIVLTLRQDYGNDERLSTIIHYFLQNAQFTSTVLSALSEVRKMFIPIKTEPRLVEILIEFLNDSTKPQRVHDTLYYLQCLIKGGNKIRHVSNLKNIGDPTNEYVSYNIQLCLKQVKQCCLSSNIFIRRAAWGVFLAIVQSGLILFSSLLPTLVATSTDIDDDIRKSSIDQLEAEKLHGLSVNCIESLKMCYSLSQNLHNNTRIRGYDCETFEPTCASWIKIALKTKTEIKTIINCVMAEIQNTEDLNFAVYLLDVLVYMPITSFDIVQHLVDLFSNTISNLPDGIQKMKVCFLTKAEEYFDSLYKISGKRNENASPNPKNTIQRKGELKDYLPHLDGRKSKSQLADDHSEMNCSLAELQRRLSKPCSVALVRIDEVRPTIDENKLNEKEREKNVESIKKPLKIVIKRKIVENSKEKNYVIENKKFKTGCSTSMDFSDITSDESEDSIISPNLNSTIAIPENINISEYSIGNDNTPTRSIKIKSEKAPHGAETPISNSHVVGTYYPTIQTNETIKSENVTPTSSQSK